MGFKHIVVVDDDPDIQELLVEYLQDQNFVVSSAENAQQLDHVIGTKDIDLIILDLMLPGEDGYSICRRLSVTHGIPMLMLTANGDDISRIVGLEMGADDYMAKPFNPRVLLAKIKALLRRSEKRSINAETAVPVSSVITHEQNKLSHFEHWTLNHANRQLNHTNGDTFVLSSQDFHLLVTLLAFPNQELSRDVLYDKTRGHEHSPYERSLDVQISRLRQRLEVDVKQPKLIQTVRGVGYLLCANVKVKYQSYG